MCVAEETGLNFRNPKDRFCCHEAVILTYFYKGCSFGGNNAHLHRMVSLIYVGCLNSINATIGTSQKSKFKLVAVVWNINLGIIWLQTPCDRNFCYMVYIKIC